MLRVGLTGGIGSGKSTAAALFAGHGVPVIDADEIARQLVTPGQPAYEQVIRTFGSGIVATNGRLDRDRLRRIVFADPEQRKRLEAILHPLVRREIQRETRRLQAPYCIIVIPLLIEANQRDLVDRVLVIDCDEGLQLQRVAGRSQLTEDEIRKIVGAQLSRNERLRHADDVILNNTDLGELRANVEALHQRYLTLARSPA
jgi:dephospho-CoA kinase